VLGGSGHIAGVVNPPAANKYGYWTGDPKAKTLPNSPDEWFSSAQQHAGSWWTDWQKWIANLNGDDMVPARDPAMGKLKVIEDAPGSFAKFRLDQQPRTQPATKPRTQTQAKEK
jgi:polyhydroxyalkanoate synthase